MLKKIACFLVVANIASAKILIITHAFNRPDFIEIQHLTFQKFLLDDYEFVIFNDAPPGPDHDAIEHMCENFGILHIPIPQELHAYPLRPSERHCDGIRYSLETLGFDYDGIVAFFDSDLFLIRPLSIEALMEGFDIASAYRRGVWGEGTHLQYLWPGLCFLRMNTLPNKETLNFNNGVIDGFAVDSGGHTYNYLQANDVNIKFLGEFPFRFYQAEIGCNALEKQMLETGAEFAYHRHFLHFGAASYWDYPPRSDALRKYLPSILEDAP
jgi:hypothetical protein